MEHRFDRETFYDVFGLSLELTAREQCQLNLLLANTFEETKARYELTPEGTERNEIISMLKKVEDTADAYWYWGDRSKRAIAKLLRCEEVLKLY